MKKYIAEEIYPKSQTGKCMVYFNMSHHYRRIYSAKPRIDTNLIKRSQSQLCCSSPDVFNFVKRNSVKQPLLMTPRHKICTKEKEVELFKPKILETQIESKLKSLPVYQTPQRILITKAVQTESSDGQLIFKEECTDIKENLKDNVALPTEKNNLESIENENNKCKATTYQKTSEAHGEIQKFSRPLDKSSVMFLKDITDDILRKGIYSNQSLEKLFTHHISKNKYSLPKEMMEKEVLRLKMELEMPLENENLESDKAVNDEEALTALDSLFLPSDIRDKVASSLGLSRKSSLPLPSPKDSFTGSLELTSMSEKQDIEKHHKNSNAQKIVETDLEQTTSDLKEDTMDDILENISSNKNSVHSEVISQHETDKTISDKEDNSMNATKTISFTSKENGSNNVLKQHEEVGTSSELSSIHTESDS